MFRLLQISLIALLAAACDDPGPQVTVYKSPSCVCCHQWVAHLRDNGFQVKTVDVPNVNVYKQQNGVPVELASCHTAVVDGYVIEGHVPARDIDRLITERPELAGLAVPGMPAGAPGMEQGDRHDPYDVVGFDNSGNRTVFDHYDQ